ncbi:L,D-transpeptidase Cds6 family protein [Arcobacter porcinus]|uniref:L,D-transpeptidase catalytic domain n=1 Tax=Arcobacter porcinus TaxID=1935204 RepID=A0A1C0AYT0_9BACT|nr:L,D-transpeptidase family protein [Arcobacter porcinus]OCL96550.1 L,D-transpeptidase catalytic domain [Aliarcobacter thereius]OCL83600.1 L,D-transpeptidase catalytic domain [Arcobacter porcinus]OCL83819.1 L,D-transpeptidase catalytic domain [Arcobacter porcinus]OCL85914.1 L,D-transpeptidase catalytic domain [Arcobacter porcinus]OCL92812.1 L,D-transpeptidase catalytic domain [Arcobacter porcinus]
MKKILFITFFALTLFAKDYFTIYKTEGISGVENELKAELREKDSWMKYLENLDTRFGYYENKNFIIVATKHNKEMALYKKDGKDFMKLSNDSMIVGEKAGDKLLEGDLKTPEGAYDLTQKRTGLDQFYGPFALVTSYPNSFDRSLNKKGHGIWIHGMPLNGNRELFTQGCLAINNDKLKTLESSIDFRKSVLLTSHDDLIEAKKEDLAIILSSIFKWKDAWKDSDLETYLSFYSKDFKRIDKTDFEFFSAQKRNVFAKKEDKIIKLFNFDISPYPNSLGKNLYRAVMDEEYYSPAVKYVGKKELYLEVINGKIEILNED